MLINTHTNTYICTYIHIITHTYIYILETVLLLIFVGCKVIGT